MCGALPLEEGISSIRNLQLRDKWWKVLVTKYSSDIVVEVCVCVCQTDKKAS